MSAPKSQTSADEALSSFMGAALGSPDTSRPAAVQTPPYGSPDDVALRIRDYIGRHGRENTATLLLYEAMNALRRPAPAAGDALTVAARDVLAERQRQISAEGWSTHHDDAYTGDQLALAASCYALPPGEFEIPGPPQQWPWPSAWWKPGDRRRELIKAGALILAEIERLDRAAQQSKGGEA